MNRETVHLNYDDFDALVDGQLDLAKLRHLDHCDPCREFVRSEKALAARLSAIPLHSPSTDFAERVLTAVIPSLAAAPAAGLRQRVFGSRRSLALAASVMVAVLGSMGASIGWSLGQGPVDDRRSG